MISGYQNRAFSSATTTGVQTGRVRMWSPKGFEFVAPDGGGRDVLAHRRELSDGIEMLSVGDRVTFTIGTDERTGRSEARGVRLAGLRYEELT